MKLRIAAWLSPRMPGPLRRLVLRRVLRRSGLRRRSIRAVIPILDAVAGSRRTMRSLSRVVRHLGH